MNDNTELLTWAVENIKEWNDDYTHFRSDCSVNPFYTKECARSSWVDAGVRWGTPELVTTGLFNELEAEFSTKTPQVITKQEWQHAKLRNASNTVLEMRHSSPCKPQEGHIHALLMAEYAEVAKTNPEPWKEFEWFDGHSEDGAWKVMNKNPLWSVTTLYRRKPSPPKTMTIGGIVVEAWPLEELQLDNIFFCINLWHGLYEVEEFRHWNAAARTGVDKFLRAGYIFSTKEQAQAVADALNKLYNDALVGWKAV